MEVKSRTSFIMPVLSVDHHACMGSHCHIDGSIAKYMRIGGDNMLITLSVLGHISENMMCGLT